jgi:hypothetical protein
MVYPNGSLMGFPWGLLIRPSASNYLSSAQSKTSETAFQRNPSEHGLATFGVGRWSLAFPSFELLTIPSAMMGFFSCRHL